MSTNESQNNKNKKDICSKYREILNMPDLTDEEINEMREHIQLLAQTICEYVWGKQLY